MGRTSAPFERLLRSQCMGSFIMIYLTKRKHIIWKPSYVVIVTRVTNNSMWFYLHVSLRYFFISSFLSKSAMKSHLVYFYVFLFCNIGFYLDSMAFCLNKEYRERVILKFKSARTPKANLEVSIILPDNELSHNSWRLKVVLSCDT